MIILVEMLALQYGHLPNGLISSHSKYIHISRQSVDKILGSLIKHITQVSVLKVVWVVYHPDG